MLQSIESDDAHPIRAFQQSRSSSRHVDLNDSDVSRIYYEWISECLALVVRESSQVAHIIDRRWKTAPFRVLEVLSARKALRMWDVL